MRRGDAGFCASASLIRPKSPKQVTKAATWHASRYLLIRAITASRRRCHELFPRDALRMMTPNVQDHPRPKAVG